MLSWIVPYGLDDSYGSVNILAPGWDETRFLGRDRDRVIRGVEFLYETETEKFYLEDYSTRPRPRNGIYKFFVRDETEMRLVWFFLNETRPRRDQIENCPRDQDETETRPRRDWDETKTKKGKALMVFLHKQEMTCFNFGQWILSNQT